MSEYNEIITKQKLKTNSYIKDLKEINDDHKLIFFSKIEINYQKSFFIELINNNDNCFFKEIFNIIKSGPYYLLNNIENISNLFLSACCDNNNNDLFFFILENFTLNSKSLDKYILSNAIKNKNIQIVDAVTNFLKDSDYNDNLIPLNYAIKSNNLDILKKVITISNPKIENNFCLTNCSSIQQLEILAPLCTDNLFIPLRSYLRRNKEEFFEYLLPFSDLNLMKERFYDLLDTEELIAKKALEKINDYLLKESLKKELNNNIDKSNNKIRKKI